MSAAEFLPDRLTLPALREAARLCRGCPLYRNATQTVFGTGRDSARLILVGEQPGHEEDLAGDPFVGPAGRLLDRALVEAGIDRSDAYVTNVVKHFKWTPAGRRRLHRKPNAAEIGACLPWLDQEIELLRPLVLVCLGATAAQAVLGRSFRVTRQRGQVLASRYAEKTLATIHPSAVLRQTTAEDREREFIQLTHDLRIVAHLLEAA